jgi:hypothetical protein
MNTHYIKFVLRLISNCLRRPVHQTTAQDMMQVIVIEMFINPFLKLGYGQMSGNVHKSDGFDGILSSPGFPEYCENHLHKMYEITATRAPIEISFSDFNTEPDHDYVSITDGDGTVLLDKASGMAIPETLKSKTKKIVVLFHTDKDTLRTGWKMNWQVKQGFCECCD